jgi:hypothetical protein
LAAACVAAGSVKVARAQDDEEPGEAILAAPITLALDRVSVRGVVEAIAKETGMQYMATDDALDTGPTVTIHVLTLPVEEVLEFLEDRLELDVDMGHLRETGILILALREPEQDEEEREEFAPQLGHAEALQMIRSHPTVARLLERRPDLAIELEWDDGDRRWEGEILLGDEEVGEVRLQEFDDADPRIVKLKIEPGTPGPVPKRRENF